MQDNENKMREQDIKPMSIADFVNQSRKLCDSTFKAFGLKTWTEPREYKLHTAAVDKLEKVKLGNRTAKQSIALDMSCSLSSRCYAKGYRSLVLFIRDQHYNSDLTLDLDRLAAVFPEYKFRKSKNNRLYLKMHADSTPIELAKTAYDLAVLIDQRFPQIEAAYAAC